jgi:transposase
MGTGRSTVVEEERSKEVRWTSRRKADAVVRLLRGEDLDEVSRQLRVEAHRLAAWRDEFVLGGTSMPKSWAERTRCPPSVREREMAVAGTSTGKRKP